MGEVASVSRHSNILKSRRHLLSCLVFLLPLTQLLWNFSSTGRAKRRIEMLLFTVVCTFQEPVHDAVEGILKSLLHFFFRVHSLFSCRALQKWPAGPKKKVKLKNDADQPRRTPRNQSAIAKRKTESKTSRFQSYSCD